MLGGVFASASGSSGNGVFSLNRMFVSSGAADFVRRGHQRLAERVALAPPLEAGDAVAREHLCPVVELQAGAQRDAPGLAVVLGDGAGDHLRLGG